MRDLRWQQDDYAPHLRVVPMGTAPSDLPTLYVDKAYDQVVPKQEIRDFYEASPILADLNLDVVESLGIPGAPLEDGFDPVLRSEDGRIWLAHREEPLAAYVPGLPTGGTDNRGGFSATVFFNAIKWLLGTRTPTPLYTLTSPAYPEPEGARSTLSDTSKHTVRCARPVT